MCRVLLLYALWLVCARLNAQWLVLQLPTTENLRSVAFCNADTGFVISALSIYRTTDGGSSWVVVASAPPPHRLYDISVPKFSLTKQTIYAVGGYMFFDFGNQTQDVGNVILKSTDFGATWQTTIGATGIGPSELNYVYALTDSIAFVMGNSGPFVPTPSLRKTADGGATWNTPIGMNDNIRTGNIDFVTTSIGFQQGGYGFLRRTSDQGNTWFGLGYHDLSKISFVDSINGYANTRFTRKTTNGGLGWQLIFETETGTDIVFADLNTGYIATSNGIVYKTITGDSVWIGQPTNFQGFLSRIIALNTSIVLIAGSSGVLLKTTNGGTSSVRESDTEKPIGFRLWQNYPNPFNPSTTIRYDLPTASIVKLQVFDLLGRSVALLVDERKDAGTYEVRFNASALASGVYFYRLEVTAISGVATGGFVETKKMVLLK